MKSQTDLGFTIEDHTELLAQVLRTRLIEEKLLSYVKSGKVRGTFHSCLGQEAVGASLALSLGPKDVLFSHHRNHGHILPLLKDPSSFLAELLAKQGALCDGRGGTQHLHIHEKFFSSGVQGSLLPVAAGWAFERGQDSSAVSVAIIGDGTLGRGVVYETLNLSALKNIPLLIVIEDNKVAQSAESKDYIAGTIEDRAKAFGIQFKSANTWNWTELCQSINQALNFVRERRKPLCLKIETFRLGPHSRGDDFRDKEIIDDHWSRDIIEILRRNENSLFEQIESVERAKIEDLFESVLQRPGVQIDTKIPSIEPIEFSEFQPSVDDGFYVQRINHAVKDLFQQNQNLKFIGEDILDPYGGAFKVPKGLSFQFPKQIIQTPISEETIAGFSHGIVLAGGACLTEFMFADFSFLAVEGITTTGEVLRSISPQMKGPVFRLPSGGGSGYGPTHSQSPERTFLSYDNIQILSLSVWADPKEILTHAINDNKCSILVEPKVLYSKKIPVDIPAGFTLFKSHEKYSTFWLRPDGPEAEVTLIAYGFGAVKAVEAISEIISKNDIIPELFILTKVSQLENFAAFKHFEGKKLLLIDDGPKNYGVMAHFAALLSQNKELPRQITLLGTKSSMIPAATDLEEKILVSVGDILQSCREME